MADQPIYLDHAAATPLDERVLAAMQPFLSASFYNPSATYLAARQTRKALQTAREQVAHWLGARPTEIIFTAGGTEANNLAIHGVMRQFADANVVVSGIEHDSILVPAARYDHHIAAIQPDGRVDLNDLEKQIDDNTVLVSIMYANNEIGTIQPIREVAQLIQTIRDQRRTSGNKRPLYLHTDACQAANYLDLRASRLGIDMMTLNGGKIYGPKQTGALYVKSDVTLLPLIDGGGQERGLRSGTENVAGAVGLAAALDIARTMRTEETQRLQALRQQFFDLLTQQMPQVVINGSRKHRLPNNLHITIPGADNERLLMQLDEASIMAAAGSACSASNEEPSHVLRAIGVSDLDAQSSLRLTMGRVTTINMIKKTILILFEKST